MGNLIPALLACIGGLNIYVFGKDSDLRSRVLVGYCVFIFSVVMLYGLWSGAIEREGGREERLIYLSEQERMIRFFRINRDLPPDPAIWVTTGEPK
jgi:hypothetical protein